MLNLSNLKVDIDNSRILNGISLSVAAGELVCLVGRNGAGKTTTFRSIMGYRRAQSGSIDFDGADLTKLPTWQIAQRGIDRYFERYYAKGPRRRPVRIEFCEADILDAFDQWRRAVGIVLGNKPAPG